VDKILGFEFIRVWPCSSVVKNIKILFVLSNFRAFVVIFVFLSCDNLVLMRKIKLKKVKIGVLVSGGGSNLQALIDACQAGKIDGQISVVISNKADAFALKRAKKHKIETVFLDRKKYKTRDAYSKALARELKKRKIGLVCLAGFMCILSPSFVKNFKYKIVNIHPALLPAFGGEGMYGHHVHEAVIKAGVKSSGCSVHFVNEGCDTGPIILQRTVPVKTNDTPETLAARVLKEEHKAYPEAVRLFCAGKLKIQNGKVTVQRTSYIVHR
jgi:phosphoribosylglycinamide formyltransferase 1